MVWITGEAEPSPASTAVFRDVVGFYHSVDQDRGLDRPCTARADSMAADDFRNDHVSHNTCPGKAVKI